MHSALSSPSRTRSRMSSLPGTSTNVPPSNSPFSLLFPSYSYIHYIRVPYEGQLTRKVRDMQEVLTKITKQIAKVSNYDVPLWVKEYALF